MKFNEEYLEEGAVLVPNCIPNNSFAKVDALLSEEWKKLSIDNPYGDVCAKYAMKNDAVTEIYDKVSNLIDVLTSRIDTIKFTIKSLLGKQAKIYEKIPLRIDAPLETKELAV